MTNEKGNLAPASIGGPTDTQGGGTDVTVPRAMLARIESMLRDHAKWQGHVDKRGGGHDEDIVILSLPNHVRIIDYADDLRDALK